MPAPEDLLKSLTGRPAALEQTLGCMTRIFHVFEGHPVIMGRRSTSTRVGIDSGRSQLRTQQTDSHSNRHDRQNPTSTMKDDKHKKTVQLPTTTSQQQQQHHRSYSDVSDLAATPSRGAFTELRTSKDAKDVEPKPAHSEGTVDDARLAFYNYESLRAAAILGGDSGRRSDILDHREFDSARSSLTSPKRSRLPKTRQVGRQVNSDYTTTQQSSSSEIRDALLATFPRETERPKKNYGSRIPVYARGLESSELLHWKDGLRSSANPHVANCKDNNKSSGATKTTSVSYHSSPERRVEPPKKDNRGQRSLSREYPPFDSRGGSRGRDFTLFEESPGACDFRESLRPFMTSAQQSARESFASRWSDSSGVSSGRDTSRDTSRDTWRDTSRDTSVNVVARLMGLDEIGPQICVSSGSKARDATSRGTFFRGLVQFDPQVSTRSSSPPPPPPCHPSKHHNKQYYPDDNHPPQLYNNVEQALQCCCEEDRDYEHLHPDLYNVSSPFLSLEDVERSPPKLADAFQAEGRNHRLITQAEICALDMKQSNHKKKKKTLWKIFEAMSPKVLLKISRRNKHTELQLQEKTPVNTKDIIIVQPVQELLEMQRQTTKSSSGADNEEQVQVHPEVQPEVQEQRTDSSNSAESCVVKPCVSQPDEATIVLMKSIATTTLSNSRSRVSSNADIFQVRRMETASSNSYGKEQPPTRRAATQMSSNLTNEQRRATKPVKSRVAAVENAPRSAQSAGSTLESDCKTHPATQHDKPDNNRESRKIQMTTRLNPGSRSPTPDLTHRKQGLGTRSSPSKGHFHGTGARKSFVATNGIKKDHTRATTGANAKAKLPKEETLKRRVSDSPVNTSRLRGSSLEHESALRNNTNKSVGAKVCPRSAVRLKQSNEGAESLGAPDTPPKELDVLSCSSTTDPVKQPRTSDHLNSPAAAAQPQPSDNPEPAVEHLMEVPHVCLLRTCPLSETQSEVQVQSEAQMIEGVSAGDDQCEAAACAAIPVARPPLLQIQEAAMEASEELTTPRGNQLKDHVLTLNDKLAAAMDRTSPVSVLDTTPFDDELTLSPTSSSKHSVVPMQDSVTTDKDEERQLQGYAKDVEAYPDTPIAAAIIEDDLDLEGDAEPDVVEEVTFSAPELHDRPHDNSSVDVDTETINENLLQMLQSNGILQENDHVLLLDCLEEIMESILESSSQCIWAAPGLHLNKGKQLEQGLWTEMQSMKRGASSSSSSSEEDICETVHNLLTLNLVRCHGPQWSTFHADKETIGLDMESMIVGDLIEEAVGDLCAGHRNGSFPFETTRRQLFTN